MLPAARDDGVSQSFIPFCRRRAPRERLARVWVDDEENRTKRIFFFFSKVKTVDDK